MMLKSFSECPFLWICLALALGSAASPCGHKLAVASPPIGPHPENPRYFLFRGAPAFLITSGEHYGAVLNADFDYIPYLDELHARGFNLTRLFSGTYREVSGSFQIAANTLAPAPGRYVAPWGRSRTGGAADGGNRFDLDRWNPAYFDRLADFVARAGERGIVVELVLFCPFYEEVLWEVNPLNARNNVNNVGSIPRTEVYNRKHPAMLARQEAFVRQVLNRLSKFDNLFYEICNEPYFGGVTLDWQGRIASVIAEEEKKLGPRHMIAQNIANGRAEVSEPNPLVSLFNFHYATPPDVLALNAPLNKPIGDDETGFRGTADRPYRTEGWDFLLAGGSLYDNLDYSFTTANPSGDAAVRDPTPGGGGPALRKQLSTLKRFLSELDFLHMKPDDQFVVGGIPKKSTVRVLGRKGKEYAIYLNGGRRASLVLDLPGGRYRASWVNPLSGTTDKTQDLDHEGGKITLHSPDYEEDMALRINRLAGP
ncbi:MAG: hypothetical protein NVSMB9_18450 [Isosphaeraceae bacterium]